MKMNAPSEHHQTDADRFAALSDKELIDILEEPAGQFGKSMILCREAAKRIAAQRQRIGKYMDHVGQCIGQVFMREIPPDKNCNVIEDRSRVIFTSDEIDYLNAVKREYWGS